MLDKQFSSLDISKNQLVSYLESVGYWGNDYLRKRNEFVLSPCAYKINSKQYENLNKLGRTIYSSLRAIAKKVYTFSNSAPKNRDDQELMGIVSRGDRKLLSPSETRDDSIPPILKVDIAQDCEGNYKVMEVDAYNPRGLGFNALLDGVGNLGSSDDVETFETMKILAKMLLSFSPSGKVSYFISDYERYYEPSFWVLKKTLAAYNVNLILIKENECEARDIVNILRERTEGFVFMIPESFQNIILRDKLLEAYKDGNLKFFFPPKAYLGSKMLLPYIAGYPEINGFIPKTTLLSKKYDVSNFLGRGNWLVKVGQSSGAKGVFFSDLNSVEFMQCIEQEKNKKRPVWILQEKINQEALMLKTFLDNEECFDKYYLRLIAQVASNGVIGLEITGRKDCMVHGAPDCVMLPSILNGI